MNDASSDSPRIPVLFARDKHGETSEIPILPGQSAARLVYASGLFEPPPLCNGLGRCGRCAMRFLSPAPDPDPDERLLLGEERLAAGHRLTCRHAAMPGMIVETDAPRIPNAPPPSAPRLESDAPARLAVDLGTTSLQWSALYRDPKTGDWTPRASGSMINPQMGFGADVMSRVAAALIPENRDRMRKLTIAALNRATRSLPREHGRAPRVEELCVAANPAMTGTLLHFDLAGLASAPYRLSYAGNRMERVEGLDAPVYVPAQASAFVGGDISAGIACLLDGLPDSAFPFLYADLGTNGEFALILSREESLSASVPMGPALEGIGLTHGRAVEKDGAGTATSFSLTPDGPAAACPVPSAPLGISGTGYLSLAHCLLRAGLMDRDGRFIQKPASPLGARIARRMRANERLGPALDLGDGLALYGRDIEELLKVKAAFSLAVARLLRAAGLDVSAVRGWRMAGAMGLHVNPADLEALGFLPPGAGLAFHAHGNMSLRGAEKMLGSRAGHYREAAARWAENTRLVELAASPETLNEFTRRMRFVF